MTIDLDKYIDKEGFVNIQQILREHGWERVEQFLYVRIDTLATAQILGCTPKTLNKYINIGLVKVDDSRRLTVYDALELRKRNLRKEAKMLEAFSPGSRSIR